MSLRTVRVKASDIEMPDILLREMDDHTFKSLVESMVDLGYVEPIQVVEKCGGGYRLVNGVHRFQVLTEVMGHSEIDVVVLGRMCCEDEKTGDCWTEEDYYLNAIRLNNIHGDWIRETVRQVIDRVLSGYESRGINRERVIKKLGRREILASIKRQRRKSEDSVEKSIMSACREIARSSHEEHGSLIVFTYGGRLVAVYPLQSRSEFYTVVSLVEELQKRGKSIKDALAEVLSK